MSEQNGITFGEMVDKLVKPGDAIIASLTPSKIDMLHMAVGISGEVAELITAIENADEANMLEEAGDIEFYFEGLRAYVTPTYVNDMQFARNGIGDSLTTCAGEILDQVKKHVIYDSELNADYLSDLMSEFRLHMTTLYTKTPFNRAVAIEANMAKLLTGEKARFAEGVYTDKQAQDRADKA